MAWGLLQVDGYNLGCSEAFGCNVVLGLTINHGSLPGGDWYRREDMCSAATCAFTSSLFQVCHLPSPSVLQS